MAKFKLPQSKAAKRRRKNILEGGGVGAVMGGIGAGPIGAAVGGLVGLAMGVHKNVQEYNAEASKSNLSQGQFGESNSNG